MNPKARPQQTDRKLPDPAAGAGRELDAPPKNSIQDRQTLVRHLDDVLAQSQPPRGAALIMLGLEPEVVINDSLRRGAGNRLVETVETRLLQLFGTEDTVARVGEDEFAILIDNLTGTLAAERVAARLIQILSRPLDLGPESPIPAVSVGIALTSGAHGDSSDVIRDAKAAMHIARSKQTGGYQILDQSHRQRLIERSTMQRNIVRALKHDEFVLHYQPIIRLDVGRPTAIEALLRWNHPTQGITTPGGVIAVAEDSQLINRIGTWALRAAVRQAGQWWNGDLTEPAPVVHVNVSPRQLVRDPIVEIVERALADSNTPPEAICLEVTESVTIEDAAIPIFNELKELGVGLSIDDFGTGHSSLNRLYRLPVDSIKLDRTFVTDIAHSRKSTAIASAVVAIGEALDLTLIAEGIETPNQLHRMKDLGYQYGQGFLFAKPQPADQFENWDRLGGWSQIKPPKERR